VSTAELAAACIDVDPKSPRIALEAVTGRDVQLIELEGGSCLIGRADFCDLHVDGPIVHSELHHEAGVLWIESADEHDLQINGKRCRRLTLRDTDTIQIGDTTITVRINPVQSAEGEDLADLSALELCERIETEQSAVNDFERHRLSGWESLLRQVEHVIHEEPGQTWTNDPRIDGVVAQLHALTDKLAARTQELAAQEALFLESAGELKRTQDMMASRLERVLQQFQDNELRASA